MTGARRDLSILIAATVVLRLPTVLAPRHLTFDEAVYGASALAMRAGGIPYRDVFSSQGPLFLPLVYLADLLGARTMNAPRLLGLISAITIVVATYVAGRAITDRAGALLAGALVTTSASVVWVSGNLSSDGTAVALATVAVALALRWRDDVTVRRALVLGLVLGAAVSVKALLLSAAVPVGLVLLASGRWRSLLVAAATTVALHFALWLPWGPADVWDQSYAYHLDVAGERTPGANLAKTSSTLGDRDMPVVVAAVLGFGVLVIGGGRRGLDLRRTRVRRVLGSPDVILLGWIAAVVVVLAVEHPMWRPHVSHLIPALALLAARHRPPWPLLAAAALVVVPYHLIRADEIANPGPYRGATAEVVEQLRDLPDGALVISDDPGLAWRAGRRTPPDLVDTSILRIEAGHLTAASIAREAARPEVCAVVVWTRAGFVTFDDLPELLRREGYEVAVEADDGRQRLYVDADCDPPG